MPMTFNDVPGLFAKSYKEFSKNDPLRLGGSTAFFTIFALPPILIILISIFGIIFNEEIISGQLFVDLQKAIGESSAEQFYSILTNVKDVTKNWIATALGFLFLVFIATTLFNVIQSNLNQLYEIKLKKRKNVKLILRKRLKSFLIIVSGGILFLASILFDSVIAYFKEYLANALPEINIIFIHLIQHLISLLILTAWFGIIFKFLPDCKIKWKPVMIGAALTAVLFTVGEIILGALLINSGLGDIYGASGAIVLVLLFVFYSSFIFFFGAAFIKAYAEFEDYKIKPHSYATKYKITEIDSVT